MSSGLISYMELIAASLPASSPVWNRLPPLFPPHLMYGTDCRPLFPPHLLYVTDCRLSSHLISCMELISTSLPTSCPVWNCLSPLFPPHLLPGMIAASFPASSPVRNWLQPLFSLRLLPGTDNCSIFSRFICFLELMHVALRQEPTEVCSLQQGLELIEREFGVFVQALASGGSWVVTTQKVTGLLLRRLARAESLPRRRLLGCYSGAWRELSRYHAEGYWVITPVPGESWIVTTQKVTGLLLWRLAGWVVTTQKVTGLLFWCQAVVESLSRRMLLCYYVGIVLALLYKHSVTPTSSCSATSLKVRAARIFILAWKFKQVTHELNQ